MHEAALVLPGLRAKLAPPMLPLAALGLGYAAGGVRLLAGIDLELGPGLLTVVMGPNGAGKSLLLRLLHGLIAPSEGAVLWAGQPADAAVRRRQSMVFQRPVLLRRSVAANIDYALAARGMPSGERSVAIRRALARARLGDLAHRPARVLSGGEQQRLALVRALSTEPDILFLDEPTASLDPVSVQLFEDLLVDAHRAGTKIVLVTHDAGQARRLADEIVFLARGRVVEHSPAQRFFTAPTSDEAADFLAGRLVL